MSDNKKMLPVNRLAGLPAEIKVEKIVSHAHSTELFVSFLPPSQRVCPKCQGTNCVIKDNGRKRTVRHIPCGDRATLLTFRHRRYLCKECGSTFYEPIYWLYKDMSITLGLYMNILRDLNSPISIRRVATNNCVSESIVRAVLDSLDLDIPSSLPETLCIDEFCGESGEYDPDFKRWNTEKFHCILANGDSGFVHDILYRMDKPYLKQYFMEYPLHIRQRVKYVCCDMHGGYISLAKECFPAAVVCLDLFHVVRRVSQGLKEVRIRIQHDLLDAGRKDDCTALKNSSRILTTAERNQSRYWSRRLEHTRERLNYALSLSPDLQEAYDALQEFYRILEEPVFALQRADLSDWIKKYTSSEVPELASAANTIKHYRGYIQNSLKYGKSNSVAEGRNRAIKEIKRNAYGHHSFKNFRRRILLAFGPVKFTDTAFTVFGEKRASESHCPDTTA